MIDGKDEEPAAVICSAINTVRREGRKFHLVGYALLEGACLVVHNHVDLTRNAIKLPDSLRIEALNSLSAAAPHCFDLSERCSVNQELSTPDGKSSYSISFAVKDDVALHARVTSNGEFLPKSEYTSKVLTWMRTHLDHHIICSVGRNQGSGSIWNWPF